MTKTVCSLKYSHSGPLPKKFANAQRILAFDSDVQLNRTGHFLAPPASRGGHTTKFWPWDGSRGDFCSCWVECLLHAGGAAVWPGAFWCIEGSGQCSQDGGARREKEPGRHTRDQLYCLWILLNGYEEEKERKKRRSVHFLKSVLGFFFPPLTSP